MRGRDRAKTVSVNNNATKGEGRRGFADRDEYRANRKAGSRRVKAYLRSYTCR